MRKEVCAVENTQTGNLTPVTESPRRIEIYDTLRGIAIIYMIFYHTLVDLEMLGFSWASGLLYSQRIIVTVDQGMFIVLSGICCSLSRNNALRGAKLLGVAMLFTLSTVIIDYRSPVTFGILHLLSISMLIFASLEKWLRKLPRLPFALLCAFLYAFTFNVKRGFFGFGDLTVSVPDELRYKSRLFIFGFIDSTYSAMDFFPLMPYLFLFLAGAFLGMWLVTQKLPSLAYKKVPFLGFLGKHSLLIYVIHQPILYGLLSQLRYAMNIGG